MRLAVCQLPAELIPGDAGWVRLRAAVEGSGADLLLLNELPFGRWIPGGPEPDPETVRRSVKLHEEGIHRLDELGVPVVLGTRPVLREGRLLNEAFVRGGAGEAPSPAHAKRYLPEEEGYWETRWFDRGEGDYRPVRLELPAGPALSVGFLICTEVWFNEWARRLGRRGADLIVVPRATPPSSTDRWRTAVRMAALVSGCWAASSNRVGTDGRDQSYGGRGWVFDPDGELVAETSEDEPVAAAELELEAVERAKASYPRYVEEPPGREP